MWTVVPAPHPAAARTAGHIETGKRLIEVKKKYIDKPGEWSQIIGRKKGQKSLLPFEKSQTYKLIRIAESKCVVQHAGQHPSDAGTVDRLVSLTAERFHDLMDNGTIHASMGRND